MNPVSVADIVTLSISVVALAVSVLLARRQSHISSGAHVISVVLNFLRELRDPDFLRSLNYVRYDFAEHHDPALGIDSLPQAAKDQVIVVGGLFEDLGKLVAFGIVDEEIIIGSIGPHVIGSWTAVYPFIKEQRANRRSQQWVFFENLAYRCSIRPASEVRARLGLRRFSPTLPTLPPGS